MTDRAMLAAIQTYTEHTGEVVVLPLGFTWRCSCGSRGKTRCRTYGYAEAGRDRHLRNCYRRLVKGTP